MQYVYDATKLVGKFYFELTHSPDLKTLPSDGVLKQLRCMNNCNMLRCLDLPVSDYKSSVRITNFCHKMTIHRI